MPSGVLDTDDMGAKISARTRVFALVPHRTRSGPSMTSRTRGASPARWARFWSSMPCTMRRISHSTCVSWTWIFCCARATSSMARAWACSARSQAPSSACQTDRLCVQDPAAPFPHRNRHAQPRRDRWIARSDRVPRPLSRDGRELAGTSRRRHDEHCRFMNMGWRRPIMRPCAACPASACGGLTSAPGHARPRYRLRSTNTPPTRLQAAGRGRHLRLGRALLCGPCRRSTGACRSRRLAAYGGVPVQHHRGHPPLTRRARKVGGLPHVTEFVIK